MDLFCKVSKRALHSKLHYKASEWDTIALDSTSVLFWAKQGSLSHEELQREVEQNDAVNSS